MQITQDTVVSFSYRLLDSDGTLLEQSAADTPTRYLHGHNAILPALERAFSERKAGDSFSLTLTPEEAYGPRRDDAHGRIALKHIRLPGQQPVKGRLKPGTLVEINTRDGLRQAAVVKMGLKHVDIDTNHPLAGKTLHFEIEVLDVKAATPEEIEHGHAHGPGGHQH